MQLKYKIKNLHNNNNNNNNSNNRLIIIIIRVKGLFYYNNVKILGVIFEIRIIECFICVLLLLDLEAN